MKRLIKKARKGNKKAFLRLFQEYEPMIYKTAYVYVRNEFDALDIVQETAYCSFKSIQQLREPTYFKTWLTRIAMNASLDFLKKRENIIEFPLNVEESTADNQAADIDLNITLQDIIEKLTPVEKSVVLLRFYQDLTIKEVAETLEIPLGTVKTILYRCLKKLRADLEGEDTREQQF